MSTSALFRTTLFLTWVAVGCTTVPSATKTVLPSLTRPPVQQEPVTVPARAEGKASPRERSEWREHFRAERVSGTIALYDSADGSLSCSNVALCGKATTPASTFKIANSIIALESGVLEHAESVLPWDGKSYVVEDWNRDQTLRSAVRVSCVPCFQAIARKVGEPRMREWLTKLDYGNHEISGGIDQFWLTGGLRISPLQQIDFLRRFEQGQLPVSKRTADTVRDIITVDIGQGYVLVGKTGMNRPPEFPEVAAWFVGWLELSERRVYFATLIDSYENNVDVKMARRGVTERVLHELQLLPVVTAHSG